MRKRVVFYCQHLLGIGHVTRSLSIVNELAKDFDVTYVQGGPPVPLKPIPSVRLVQLDPLLMQESDSVLYDPEGRRAVPEIFSARREALAALAAEGFDACVVELYPFGRKKFAEEVRFFLGALRARRPGLPAVCSVRDILVEKSDAPARNRKIVAELREYFQAVWVHADPALIEFGATFSAAPEIADLLRYTGFVAEPARASAAAPRRGNKILLSLGGGSVGGELFLAAAEAVPEFPEHEFHFALGPYTPAAIRETLENKLAGFGARARVTGLLTNFEEELSRAALSVSMAGYNTVMNLLNTRTPGLVLTYDANHEQLFRARLLEERGYLGVLEPADLTPARLKERFRERLGLGYPAAAPDLRGAARCRGLLSDLLAARG